MSSSTSTSSPSSGYDLMLDMQGYMNDKLKLVAPTELDSIRRSRSAHSLQDSRYALAIYDTNHSIYALSRVRVTSRPGRTVYVQHDAQRNEWIFVRGQMHYPCNVLDDPDALNGILSAYLQDRDLEGLPADRKIMLVWLGPLGYDYMARTRRAGVYILWQGDGRSGVAVERKRITGNDGRSSGYAWNFATLPLQRLHMSSFDPRLVGETLRKFIILNRDSLKKGIIVRNEEIPQDKAWKKSAPYLINVWHDDLSLDYTKILVQDRTDNSLYRYQIDERLYSGRLVSGPLDKFS